MNNPSTKCCSGCFVSAEDQERGWTKCDGKCSVCHDKESNPPMGSWEERFADFALMYPDYLHIPKEEWKDFIRKELALERKAGREEAVEFLKKHANVEALGEYTEAWTLTTQQLEAAKEPLTG